jgi:predicted acetyltransferase
MTTVVRLYNKFNATRTGSIARNPDSFTKFHRWADLGKTPEPVLWEDEQSNLLAYAMIDKDSEAVRLTEVEAVDDKFYAAVLNFLAQQGVEKRCESITVKLPFDHPFAEYAQRYGMVWEVKYPRSGSGMMRIINQKALFAALLPEFERRIENSPFRGHSGHLTIHTDLGTTRLDLFRGNINISTNNSGNLMLKCPQDNLMQLLVGYRSVRDVVNDKEVLASGDVIPLMNVLFPKGIPYMYFADHF